MLIELDKFNLSPTNLTNDAGSLYLYLSSPLLLLEGSSLPFLFSAPGPFQASRPMGFGRGNQKPDSKKIKENLPSLIKLKTTLISIFNL